MKTHADMSAPDAPLRGDGDAPVPDDQTTPLPGGEDTAVPLVVDLDGTLIRSDLLIESAFRVVARDPAAALRLPGWLRAGKPVLKARLADRAQINPATLPYNEPLIERLRKARAAGRPLYLASASDERLVAAVADHLGLFDGHFGSTEALNLAGSRKADRLVAEFGTGGFDYIGDDPVDMPVWEKARRAIATNHGRGVAKTLTARFPDHEAFAPRIADPRAYLRALRPHQWAKNALLFLPMLTAHAITPGNVAALVIAFAAFSMVASAVYLVNDLFDLAADREHATKRFRPLASGAIPIRDGVLLTPLLLALGFALALAVSAPFVAVLAGYFALTLGYSMYLKRKAIVDVMTLAGLYTVRVLAGAAALTIPVSEWLLAFSIFLFLSLALVKRMTELKERIDTGRGKPSGRGYQLADIDLIRSLATSASFAAVVVFTLYISSPTVQALYARPEGLWLVGCLLMYWLARVLLLTHRGEMHDDPVIFALRDRISRLVLACVVVIVLASS